MTKPKSKPRRTHTDCSVCGNHIYCDELHCQHCAERVRLRDAECARIELAMKRACG